MSGKSQKKKGGRERRFSKRQMLWEVLPGGGHYPFGLRARMAEVLHRLGDFSGLERLCQEDLERGRGDDRVVGFCLMKLGTLAAQRGDGETGRDRLVRSLEHLERSGEEKNAFICRTALVNISLMQHRFAEAEVAANELASQAGGSDDHSVMGTVLNLQGLVAMEQGHSHRALEIFERKLEMARRHRLLTDQATALGNIARANHDLGRYAEAEAAIDESLTICRGIGDPYLEYYILYILAEAYEAQGKLTEAERCYREDLALARQLGDGPGAEQILGDIARVEKSMKGA